MVNGLSGERMLVGLAIGIAILIFLVLKTKVQAFLALIICTVIVGIVGGMPLSTITLEDGKAFGIVNSITTGFGGTLGSIGIIIGFGVMMGQLFEATGAAKRMAHTFLRLFGKKREEEALALTGFLVSIPIFCDSGFVVLAPIAKAISKATKKSIIGLGVALAAGLVITHSMVPPTPGPLGVCGIFDIDVGKFILLSLVLSLPMAIACIAYARLYLSKKYYRIPNDEGEIVELPYQEPDYENAFSMDVKGLPGTFIPAIDRAYRADSDQYGCQRTWKDRRIYGNPHFPWTADYRGRAWTSGGNLYIGKEAGSAYGGNGDGTRNDVCRYHHAGYRWRRSPWTDHQGFRTWYIYGRRPCKDGDSDHHPSASDFNGNALHPGFWHGRYDNSRKHLCPDRDRGRRKSSAGRGGMLRGLPVLWIL